MERTDGFAPIADYAAIGDGRAVALIARDGAIDWTALPRIDSPALHAALLDPSGGGRLELAPREQAEVQRRYLPGTNLLETTFRTSGGALRVTDAITLAATGAPLPWHELVRRVEALEGEVVVDWRWEPRPEFGRRSVDLTRHSEHAVIGHRSGLDLALASHDLGDPTIEGGVALGSATLHQGESGLLVLVGSDGRPLALSGREELQRRLDQTADAWRRWLARASYDGPHRDAVLRSLLTLKMLTHPSGAIAAAATTSLPEVIGGERNFDYRFAWVRDLSFAIDAYLRVGLDEEATDAIGWLLDAATATHPRPEPMYRIDGSAVRGQGKLPLPGYRHSTPVHIGNDASSQLQLGGFGDLIEPCWLHHRHGHPLGADNQARIMDLLTVLEQIWRDEDAGLWELSQTRGYANSKVGCWVAFDRGVKLAESGGLPRHRLERWRVCRDQVRDHIESELWSDARGSYIERAGDDMSLDASWLLAVRRGYAKGDDPRMSCTIDTIRRELDAGAPLLYRLSRTREEENAFVACSFWLVEALVGADRGDEAAALLDDLIGCANDVGLYSEEMQPYDRTPTGNVPQALTHLSLIHAAAALSQSQVTPGVSG